MKKVFFLLILFFVQSLFAQRVVTTVERNKPTVLTLSDTLEYLRQKGDTCMMQLHYDFAAFYYRKLLELDLSNSYALRRFKEAERAQKSICKNEFTHAEKLFYGKSYLEAKAFYEKVVARGCDFSPIATERLVQIKKILKSNKKNTDK